MGLRISQELQDLVHGRPALAAANRAVKINPKYFKWKILRAKAYIASKRYEDALADLNAAANRGAIDVFKLRAQVYDKLGKPDLAETDRRTMRQLVKETYEDWTPPK